MKLGNSEHPELLGLILSGTRSINSVEFVKCFTDSTEVGGIPDFALSPERVPGRTHSMCARAAGKFPGLPDGRVGGS